MNNLRVLPVVIGAFVCAIFGIVVAPVSAASTPQSGTVAETIYYSDSLERGDGASVLYEATIDELNQIVLLREIIRLDASLGFGDWDHVDVLAASPDGRRLFFIDDGPISNPNAKLGTLNLDTGVVSLIGSLVYSDTGPAPYGASTTDLASVGAEGTLYVGRVDTDALYRVDIHNAHATRIGPLKVVATGATVNMAGGDLAFDNTGRLYLLTNYPAAGAPRGLYRSVSTEMPLVGDVNVEFVGPGSGLLYSGLAFRKAGTGDLLGSAPSTLFNEINRDTAETVRFYIADRVLHSGDLTTGQLAICTRTIGYRKTHSWKGRTITINGEVIDEALGKQILWHATSRNFSMLWAQLIGAKLNCESCGGAILEAEGFLLTAGITTAIYDAEFVDKNQKSEATRLSQLLDAYNNSNHCDKGSGKKPRR
jgi:hypothetical protein